MNLRQVQEKLKALRQIQLLPQERAELRSVLTRKMNETMDAPSGSFWSLQIHFRRVALASLIAVGVFSGAMTVAAGKSLPGELFYPFKVGINEKIARFFVSPSTEATARFEAKLVEKRLIEAERLIEQAKLDDIRKEAIRETVDTQATRAFTAIEKIKEMAGEKADEEPEQENDGKERNVPKKKDKDAPDLDAIFEKHREAIEKINYQPVRAAGRNNLKK